MPESLPDLLNPYEFAALQTIANYNGYKSQTRQTKADLVRLLTAHFSDPARVRQHYNELSPAEREIIWVLQRQGGTASCGGLARRLRDLGLIGKEDRNERANTRIPNYRDPNSRYLEELLAHLQAIGLVVQNRTSVPWGNPVAPTLHLGASYRIAPAVLALLPLPPALPDLPVAEAPARILESSARVFQRDLYLYWSYVYRVRPDLIAKGYLSKRHLTALNETLLQRETITTGKGEADFPRLVFIRALLTELKLLETKNSTLSACSGDEFFGADPAVRIRRIWETYLDLTGLNELLWITLVGGYHSAVYPVPPAMLQARRAIAAHLRQVSGWTAFNDLIVRIRTTQYEFFLPRTLYLDSYAYAPSHPYGPNANALGWVWSLTPGIDESAGWEQVEAKWIRWLVSVPMAWMGLVDLGFRPEDAKEASFFRLTPLGRWLLANGPQPEIPQGGGQVVVQPDFTIMAFDPISDIVLFRLEQLAQRVSAERAVVLRLSQQSVYAAQQNGWSAELICTYLEELSHQPLPANVARTLQEWQAVHERIRIYPHVNVLHAAHPADLDEVSANKKIAPLLEQRLAPDVVVLPAKSKPGEVRNQLLQISWYTPITPPNADLPRQSVTLDENGRLRFVQRTSGIYLRAHLARFAEPEGEDYRLTPASIRRAVNAGLTAPNIVAELERVLVQPVPPALAHRILAWSGYYGQVEAEEVTLLRFKNGSAIAELLEDPDLSKLLRTLRPDDIDRLALVRAKDLAQLRRLLEERGVEWKE